MRQYAQDCPIARTLDLIGDRWTLLIIRDMFLGMTRFSQLREHSSIPPKVLSARLKMLMENGVIRREVYSEHPLRASYHLTARGDSLQPVILAIGEWGIANMFEGEPELRDQVARAIYNQVPGAREVLKEGGYV